MALFSKNWFGHQVNQGEPLIVDWLDRKFGKRKVEAFKIDGDTGQVTINKAQITGAAPLITVGVLGAGAANSIDVTIQMRDISGVALSKFCRVAVWVTDTTTNATKTPVGTDTTGLTTAFPTGTLALTKLANLDFDVITNSKGKVVCRLTDAAGAQTRFVNIEVGGVVYTSGPCLTT